MAELLERFALNSIEEINEEPKGINDFDWKNLIILDGCRHDLYEEEQGSTDFRITKGSASQDFISENFSKGNWSDTVVITANPFYNKEKFKEETSRELEDVFHTVFPVYETKWDDKNNTVLPEDMVAKVRTAKTLFPEKRKIIHFMQPHYPFVNFKKDDTGFSDALKEGVYFENIWQKAMKGKVSHEIVYEGYKDNLEYVIPYAEECVELLEGKTVITSDHGNLLGEKGFYGHPRNSKAKPLRKVPMDMRQ